jgi:hypothetical protein
MSTPYRPLFSIAVEHGFFAPGSATTAATGNFRLLPTP